MSHFWPGAGRPDGFFPRLVTRALGEPVRVVTSARDRVDLEIVRADPSLLRLARGRLAKRLIPGGRDARWADQRCVRPSIARSVWFTAENVRPPSTDDWAGFLSFDTDPLGGRNAYLPLWILDLKDYNSSGDLRVNDLLEQRIPDVDRKGFVCAFIGNPDPMRFHAIDALQEIGPVDIFGRSVGRPVSNKNAVARGYRYILTFENDLYPGYVTEKILDGARTGCIPLYRGLDVERTFNANAQLNCLPEGGTSELVKRIQHLESNPEERAKLLREPVMHRPPNLSPVETLLRRVMDNNGP